jgi:hypothetical protein
LGTCYGKADLVTTAPLRAAGLESIDFVTEGFHMAHFLETYCGIQVNPDP